MKFKYLLIGIMLALVLCIGPVAAVSGDDFEIDFYWADGYWTYEYHNYNNPDEKYIEIYTAGTEVLNSIVTFKPANIPDAPLMVVDTTFCYRYIKLPSSVDEWEIKYYSKFRGKPSLEDENLNNAGTVNLKEEFGEYIDYGLTLELSWGQYIRSARVSSYGELLIIKYWYIPDVD